MPGRLFRSIDGGASWFDLGPQLPSGAGNSASPLVLGPRLYLLGTWGTEGSGVFRSTDGGESWPRVAPLGVAGAPVIASDGLIYWLLRDGLGIIRSRDKGVTWSQPLGAGFGLTANLIELPGGSLAAMGTSALQLSKDGGASWVSVGTKPPFAPSGIAYSKFRRAFYLWHATCTGVDDSVQPEAILRSDFDSLSQPRVAMPGHESGDGLR